MGDLHVVDVSLNLPTSAPDTVLSDLRWHLGIADPATANGKDADEFPVWAARGPATRIGGVRVGELAPGTHGWSLTVRQEVHEEALSDAEGLINRLVRHSTTEGLIGQIRFFESDTPDLLINRSGILVKVPFRHSAGEIF
jgi:hypothetical protein